MNQNLCGRGMGIFYGIQSSPVNLMSNQGLEALMYSTGFKAGLL